MIENNITSLRYILTIARLEPENNLELMCDSYIESNLEIPYYIIGNHLTKYGDFLKDKYRRKGIYFLGPIYNKSVLDSIRFYSTFYLVDLDSSVAPAGLDSDPAGLDSAPAGLDSVPAGLDSSVY